MPGTPTTTGLPWWWILPRPAGASATRWRISIGRSRAGRSTLASRSLSSDDGIHWRKHPQAPLLRTSYGDFGEKLPFSDEAGRPWSVPLSISDALEVMYDTPRKTYAIYTKMWIDRPDGGMYWKHAMGRTVSSDFIHWSRPELLLTPDDLDPSWLEFHASPVFFYNDCYFALLQILRRDVGGGVIDIELALSRDGLRWERPFRKDLFLTRGEGQQFDSGSIFLDNTPVYLENEFRFYYGAYSGGATGGDDYSFQSGIGLATLERDRFVGIQPTDHIGQITLKPLDLSRIEGLSLNADALRGAIRVEVLNSTGLRIRGFTREDASPLTGDGPCASANLAGPHGHGAPARPLHAAPASRGRSGIRSNPRGQGVNHCPVVNTTRNRAAPGDGLRYSRRTPVHLQSRKKNEPWNGPEVHKEVAMNRREFFQAGKLATLNVPFPDALVPTRVRARCKRTW